MLSQSGVTARSRDVFGLRCLPAHPGWTNLNFAKTRPSKADQPITAQHTDPDHLSRGGHSAGWTLQPQCFPEAGPQRSGYI
ncbi:hypothetical protein EYF80_052689 [Liparis tanakae]|uniref:Uncharacterized protein n=1 Tax=Liparis tanakae TaxID=230148 RepID=A0A4Z2F809_9TELE|nr:hypothetical protein EYF80_052689 [Liparis tanakae]